MRIYQKKSGNLYQFLSKMVTVNSKFGNIIEKGIGNLFNRNVRMRMYRIGNAREARKGLPDTLFREKPVSSSDTLTSPLIIVYQQKLFE